MVWSGVLKKDGYFFIIFFKLWLFFYIPFILLCNWIKQAEISKTLVSIYQNLDFSKSTRHTNTGTDIRVVSELC